MLTDYHLHLRPDEEDTPPSATSPRENVDRYLEAAAEPGSRSSASPSTSTASTRRSISGATRSGRSSGQDDLDAYCEFVRGTPLRLGIECDFVPGAEDRTAALLEARDFDYVVGSVHFVGERGASTTPAGTSGRAAATPTRSGAATSRRSPSAPAPASSTSSPTPTWSRSGAAPGRCRERDLRHFYEPAVEAIAESGIAVEVSTAGLRKPVGELYPARGFAEMCVEAGAPFALSSDAHLPEHVGFAYDRALEFLDELGVGEICVFERRQRRLAPLGSRVG